MRKLLILMLVLGMASMANAGISLVVSTDGGETYDAYTASSLTINTSETVLIGVYNTAPTAGTGFFDAYVIVDNPGTTATGGQWTGNGTYNYPPGAPGGSIAYLGWSSLYGDQWTLFNSEPTVTPIFGGISGEFEFHCTDVGSIDVYVMDFTSFVEYDRLTIHQIPEPMTMALLGLGGLFLRRRK